MTFPVLEDTTRGVETSQVMTHDVVLPATVNTGEILFVRFIARGGAITWDHATVGPWQVLHDTTHPNDSNYRFFACWRICDGSEDGATLAVTTAANGRSAWHVDRFSGAQGVEAATPATQAGGSQPNPPSLNPSWGTEDVHWIASASVRNGGVTPGVVVAPTNYTNKLFDDTGGGSGGTNIASAYRQLNAESEDPSAWFLQLSAANFANTYAVRSGATLLPPRLDVGVTFFAPSVRQIVAPPRLNVGVQFFAPKVASLKVLQPPRLNVAVTLFAPTVSAALLPPRLDVGVTFFAPTVLQPGTLRPPRLDVGVEIFPPLVEGGFRPLPVFNRVSFGPFPGAIGDAAIGAISTENFENRWSIRGPIGFTNFAPFVASMYEFDEAYVWLRLVLDVGAPPAIAITQALMHIDVPDTRDSGEAEIPVGGDWVNFVRTFNSPPDVVAQVIRASAVTEAPKATVRDDIETGRFFVTCHTGDDTDLSVAARIKWIAQGF